MNEEIVAQEQRIGQGFLPLVTDDLADMTEK